MSTRGRRAAGLLTAAALVLAACSSSGTTPTPTRARIPTVIGTGAFDPAAAAAVPALGLVAIGHSGLTGYDSDEGGFSGLDNSWATGTNPRVDSIYQRLRSVQPTITGHVANVAVPGARVSFLPQEAVNATTTVAHPQLAIIQTIGNDITCDGKDQANYAVFGEWLSTTLADLTHLSPQTKILVLSNLGRPTDKAAAVAADLAARKHESGNGACKSYDSAGVLQPGNIRRLTAITENYERVERSVCRTVSQCTYDGALARYTYRLADLIPGDWDHLNVAGQKKLAALIWPAVAKVLGVRS